MVLTERRWRTSRVFCERFGAGRQELAYSGRVKPRGQARSLKPSRYRVSLRPSDRAGNRGTVLRLGLTVSR